MKRCKLISAAVAAVCFAGAAFAAVTFDASNGVGFVGKGDVQNAFGWNNGQLQENAAGVAFAYSSVDTYAATCTWITGEGTRGEKTHNVNIPRHTTVSSGVAYDPRRANQITGFNLTGFNTTTSGNVPVVGGECVNDEGNGHDGTWSAVTLVSSTSQLEAIFGGLAIKIWP